MNTAMISMLSKKAPQVTRYVSRKKLMASKNAPHIMFGLGLVGSVASTVLACKATLQLSDMLDEIQSDIDEVKQKGGANYPKEEAGKDLAYVYIRSAGRLGRLYGPSLAVGVVSIGCLSGAHINLTRRNTALMAAYAAVQNAYDNYRERVMSELGEDREREIYHAVSSYDPENGEDPVKVADPTQWSPYARMFDEQSQHFHKNAELNRLFIQCQQNWANDMLRARGHVFLNEVYDFLGFERTREGSVVGWLIGPESTGDEYIDFGMYAATSAQFINGWEPRVILDFNVDGVIYDKI